MLDNRNLIVAILLSVTILIGFQLLYGVPNQEELRDPPAKETSSEDPLAPSAPKLQPSEDPNAVVSAKETIVDRKTAIASSSRLKIRSQRLTGSILLKGAQIDDLTLLDYGETSKRNSKRVVFLAPTGTANPYVARFGWVSNNEIKLPDSESVWTPDQNTLTPEKPVTLSWDNGAGLVFRLLIELDEHYMFRITQSARNATSNAVKLFPYGRVFRDGAPETMGFFILHEGAIGVFDDVLEQIDYDDMVEEQSIKRTPTAQGGWIGVTDKYWLTALIPDKATRSTFSFSHAPSPRYCSPGKSNLINITPTKQKGPCGMFQVDYMRDAIILEPGQTGEVTDNFFAGAKVVRLLDNYSSQLDIPRFDRAVDFGLLFFLTKPIFLALRFFSETVGNFGLSILILTVIIKLLFFPLANRSYRAMSKMKKLAPEMKKLRERYKNDRQKQQQEIMALYKKEGANPISGCLPILIQIPVFFALYKVLFVTIEMRHAPFFGWIQDLSAPDPMNLFTLFGALPWSPPSFIPILGIWPLIMGFSMWLQMRLNPQPMDPMQARIFMIMPVFFTLLLASFPAGLVIYWTWNNILSIAQQWVIMRQEGVKNPAAAE